MNTLTPKQYVEKLLQTELKGNARVWITNMLNNSHSQSSKDFYKQALKELDLQ